MIPLEMLMRDDERFCKECGAWKHKNQFIKNFRSRTGYLQTCKLCIYTKRSKKTMKEITAMEEIIHENQKNNKDQFKNPIISVDLRTGKKSGYGIRKLWERQRVQSWKHEGDN